MPEQLREALEEATLNRRQAMEKAFDDLSGDSNGEDGESEVIPVSRTTSEGTSEEVIKTDGNTGSKDDVKTKSPIIDESKKPLKPIARTAKDTRNTGRDGGKAGQETKTGEKDGAKTTPPKFKAPNTWKPAAREHWNSLPEGVQEEISRREGEVTKVLNDSAAARRLTGELQNIVRPFEGLIRSSGVTPMQAIGNLMNTAATLQTGTTAQKVNIIKDLISIYGVDLRALDLALAGKAPAANGGGGNTDELGKLLDQRLKPVNDFMRTIQTTRTQSQQALIAESQQTMEEFANDPKNEFFSDLREDIADILDLAANRGREMTLEQAYNLAAKQHPEISKVINDREAAKKITQSAQALERSRRAASSQRSGTPGGTGVANAKPANRREAISQAWDDLSGR